MHLKRNKIPKNWPISRKGTKYVVRTKSSLQESLPVLILLRDLLKIAQNRKEVKKMILNKFALLNNKSIKDEKTPASLFDVLKIVPLNKNYRFVLTPGGVFTLEEIKEKEAGLKIAKISNKKVLKKNKVQLNLSDGNNFISDVKCKINDSVLINLNKKQIEKCIPLKEKSEIVVIAGKHSGKKGVISKIEDKKAIIKTDKENISTLIKQIIVIE